MLYSPSTSGFYSRDIHGDAMPIDAIEISDDLYRATAGQSVVPDANGLPSLYVPPPYVAPVPVAVSMRQARLALLTAGKLADVKTAIDALPGDEGEAARIEWEFAANVERDSPIVAMLAQVVGLDADALDALFLDAATR